MLFISQGGPLDEHFNLGIIRPCFQEACVNSSRLEKLLSITIPKFNCHSEYSTGCSGGRNGTGYYTCDDSFDSNVPNVRYKTLKSKQLNLICGKMT
jgi:hypothetical protein